MKHEDEAREIFNHRSLRRGGVCFAPMTGEELSDALERGDIEMIAAAIARGREFAARMVEEWPLDIKARAELAKRIRER